MGDNYIENCNNNQLKHVGHNNNLINCKFVGDNIRIGNNCTIVDSVIGDGCYITDSFVEKSVIGKNVKIGPYSHLRPNCNIGNNCKIGNFVEIKNSQLGQGVKVSHLSYVGDAMIGDNTNIGCGVVFANYNGFDKNMSIVGKNCFLGCNVNVVAPIKIADDTYICAGTTVTENSKEGDFVVGRVKAQTIIKHSYFIQKRKNK